MDLSRAWNLVASKLAGWVRDFVLLLPNLAIAVLVLVAFWAGARLLRNLLLRLLRRISHSDEVNRFVAQAVYIAVIGSGLFVSLGILGILGTAWFVFGSLVTVGRFARRVRGPRSDLAAVCAAAIGAFAVSMLVFDAFAFVQSTIIFFVIAALGLQARRLGPRPADT